MLLSLLVHDDREVLGAIVVPVDLPVNLERADVLRNEEDRHTSAHTANSIVCSESVDLGKWSVAMYLWTMPEL